MRKRERKRTGEERKEKRKKENSEEGRVLAAGRLHLPAVAVYWLVESCKARYEKVTGGRECTDRSSRNKKYMLPAISEMLRTSIGTNSPRSDKQNAVLQARSGRACARRGSGQRHVALAVPEYFSSAEIYCIFPLTVKKIRKKIWFFFCFTYYR